MPELLDPEVKHPLLSYDSKGEVFDTLRPPRTALSTRLATVAIVVASLIASFFAGGRVLSSTCSSDLRSSSTSSDIAIRKEWRSLSRTEKREYIEAVQCLHHKPSRLGLNQSLYHDFAWVHYRVGSSSHKAAPFLAWHRYFLHAVHGIMQSECNYRGEMTYWDWSLDWEDMTAAPVWDAELGFGGNGDPNIGEEILHGHCVVDGPFANTSIPFLDNKVHAHCLSRGFEQGENLREHGAWFGPDAVHDLLQKTDYNDFNLRLEFTAHNGVPRSIRGDFLLLTAPFDPVFFLHHTQLDRLWHKWQHRSRANMYKYNGASFQNSSTEASLHDLVDIGGLGPPVTVSQILDTESAFLHYTY